jgi:hypothetical protein
MFQVKQVVEIVEARPGGSRVVYRGTVVAYEHPLLKVRITHQGDEASLGWPDSYEKEKGKQFERIFNLACPLFPQVNFPR